MMTWHSTTTPREKQGGSTKVIQQTERKDGEEGDDDQVFREKESEGGGSVGSARASDLLRETMNWTMLEDLVRSGHMAGTVP